jgi:type IV pilus assembly protein PilF
MTFSPSVKLGGLLWVVLAVAGCSGPRTPPETQRSATLDIDDQMRLAQSYLNAGRFRDAIDVLEKATTQEPELPTLRNFYGQVLFLAGRDEAAEVELLKALELDPYLTDARNNLGIVLDRMGRKDEAEQTYLAALKDPSYATPEKVLLNLGLLYGSQGRDELAIEKLRRAVEINSRYYQAHYELAALLDRTGRLEEAASEYEVALPAYETSGEYFYRLGFAFFKLGDTERARRELLRVQELAPGSTHAVKADDLLKMMK